MEIKAKKIEWRLRPKRLNGYYGQKDLRFKTTKNFRLGDWDLGIQVY